MTSENGERISSRFKSLNYAARSNPVPDWSSNEDGLPFLLLHRARPNKKAGTKNESMGILER